MEDQENYSAWGVNTNGGVRAYNVGRVSDKGVEVYQVYPPLTMAEAVDIRDAMQRLGSGNYGIFNVESHNKGGEI